MTEYGIGLNFRKSCLAALVGMLLSSPAYALQNLSDEHLANTTGEGIALLPENFKMVFQRPNDVSAASSYTRNLDNPEQYDTGFIRIIPVGENYDNLTLSQTDAANQRTKADIFIYGLALSETNNNINQRYSNQGFDWGSAANPWLFRAGTDENIRQFDSTNAATDISYISLEAPLAKVDADDQDNNIKLGLWLDAFSRSWNSSNKVDPITGAPVTTDAVNDPDLLKNQRIRLQLVANGLSLSGSQVRLFQTMPSTNAVESQTLGMASLIRLNTNDNPEALIYENTQANKELLNARGLRISTATLNDGTAVTPALDRSLAPIFHAEEGLYLYSPNINLVLGNMHQPFILGSEGQNIILEVTRIPNVPEIYKQIYTYYADIDGDNTEINPADYKGSTCNVAYCGSNISQVLSGAGTTNYQGTNATHSSISIGSVTRDPTTNLLKANTASNSTGVVFRSPHATTAPVNLGSVAIDGVLIQHLKFKTTGL